MENKQPEKDQIQNSEQQDQATPESEQPESGAQAVEIGGRKGPEPTRYGDWEKNGRCIDF